MPVGGRSVRLALSVVVCGALLGGAAAAEEGGDDDELRDEVSALLERDCVPYLRFRAVSYPRAEVRRAVQEGRFEIEEGVDVTLKAPVDWQRKGRHPRPSVRSRLQSMRFLDVLFYAHEQGSERALRRAVSLGVDWSRSHLRGDANHDPTAFHRVKTIGDRVGYLANLARAAACRGELHRGQAEILVRTLLDHGERIAGASYYPSNQGLFQDIGLLLLADRYLPFLDPAPSWEALARSRFPQTLDGRLGADGIWQEHSVTYQFLVIEAAIRFLRAGGPNAEVASMLQHMQKSAPWLVAPGGRFAQLGDTDFDLAPSSYRESARGLRGLRLFDHAGFAMVRGGRGDYLAVTAQFHNLSHKQQDELSFELYENGKRIVAGPGRYGYGKGERREYTVSPRSHSVLTVDGKGFGRRLSEAYGSAIVSAEEVDGAYAIVGRNPLLRRRGVHHRRTFIYEPGEALVIEDRVSSERAHRYTRFLQLGPEIEIAPGRAGTIGLRSGKAFRGCVIERRFVRAGGERGLARRVLVRGRHDPMQGFTFPEEGRAGVPRWSIAHRMRGSTVRFVTVIDLDGRCPRPREDGLPELPATPLEELLTDLLGR